MTTPRLAVLCRRVFIAVALTATAGVLIFRFAGLPSREFDSDELEHAHVAWLITQGGVPYRDFFEMHTPLFYYAVAGLFSPLDPEESGDAGLEALLLARRVTWGLSVVVIALTWLLARRTRGPTAAWFALPLVAFSIVVALRAPEIRPDGLSTCFWLSCLLFFDAAMRHPRQKSATTLLLFAASGLAIGLAVATSQKLLFAGPSLAASVLLYVTTAGPTVPLSTRLLNAASQIAGVVLPWLAVWLFFASQGAGGLFLQRTVFANLGWTQETSAWSVLRFLSTYDPWLLALAAGGLVILTADAWSGRRNRTAAWLLCVNAIGLFAGLFLSPVPYPQYCLTFIPLFAILAGAFLEYVTEGAGDDHQSRLAAIATAAFVMVAMITVPIAQPFLKHPAVYPAVVGVAMLAVILRSWHRIPDLARCAVLLALIAYPVQWSLWLSQVRGESQQRAIRYVLDQSPVDATVMDGWSGYGVFRPHASYYWMLHPGVRGSLTPDDVRAIERVVTSDGRQPDFVVLDDNLRALSSTLASSVQRSYQPTGIENLYVKGAPAAPGATR